MKEAGVRGGASGGDTTHKVTDFVEEVVTVRGGGRLGLRKGRGYGRSGGGGR